MNDTNQGFTGLISKLDGKIDANRALLLNLVAILAQKDPGIADRLAARLYRAKALPGFSDEAITAKDLNPLSIGLVRMLLYMNFAILSAEVKSSIGFLLTKRLKFLNSSI